MRSPSSKLSVYLIAFLLVTINCPVIGQQNIKQAYSEKAQKIIQSAMENDSAFTNLSYFGDKFGHRFSGSESLENSLDWIVEELKQQGFTQIIEQNVKVPHWVRGNEHATLLLPREKNLPMLGLGGSVSTPSEGITADVIVVQSFDDLQAKKEEVEGKIVLYNVPFTTYGETVQYRLNGAIEAAKLGAVASLIRSVTPYSMKTPHTGTSRYQEGVPKIPHAAITLEDAEMIQRMSDREERIRINLYMEAKTLPDTDSRNIIFELKGSEKPEEIIVMGGHIDSWDVGQGLMDDAGGCFAAWEALKIIKELGLRPKRTIRVVFWTNEENGLRGANAYRDMVEQDGSLSKHILAIESDSGVFDPIGFGFTGSDEAFNILRVIGSLLEPIDSGEVFRGGGGADIGPLLREGVPGMGLRVDGEKYFWYHHTDADTIDKLNEQDYKECIATMALFAYVVADMEESLPR